MKIAYTAFKITGKPWHLTSIDDSGLLLLRWGLLSNSPSIYTSIHLYNLDFFNEKTTASLRNNNS